MDREESAMAKKKAARKFNKLKFDDDSPLPPELRQKLEQIDMNHLSEIVAKAGQGGVTEEERAMFLEASLSSVEAHQLMTGSDSVEINLLAGALQLKRPEEPSA